MFRRFVSLQTCLLTLCCFAPAGLRGADGEVLRLRADSWMPYNGDPADERPGYVVEMARLIFEPRGIKVDYRQMPWTDALKAARAGEVDGVIGANEVEAEGLIMPAEPIGLPRIVLVARKESTWQYSNVAALSGTKVGVIDGYSYWDGFDAYIKTHQEPDIFVFKGETPLADAIARLKSGGIDVLAETLSVFIWTAKSSGYSPADFRIAYSHHGEPVFVAFSKNAKGERFARIFDEGVNELRTKGGLGPILKRYGLSDWK
jgi:polar amino acid transport system substrate-binding protein